MLVVDTVGFLPGMLGLEVAHGPDLHVIERFSLNADGSVLTCEDVAEDSDYFVGHSNPRLGHHAEEPAAVRQRHM